jgi:peptide deformylase
MQEIASGLAIRYIGCVHGRFTMPVKEIALLGNPILRKKCLAVKDMNTAETRACIADMKDTLEEFRACNGFGRGIAAPQIGTPRKIIYLDFDFKGALINPKIVRHSKRTFTLWDDCFSFPDLLVKVVRHYAVAVSFTDEAGARRTLRATGAFAELLQHEIDHLHGILAIDRAVDSRHIVFRSEFSKLAHNRAMTL